ncbi:ABC transporter substrate-binding protein [Streptomyces profundus]|uniref:ABC transporter substrate-binding protein n=1 Tax=Streptomyces profundus TaxID=2867410 RepID=UPI001D1646D6|nr:ABC transporter substrate-binding protein [Streptomyces sp. MA3_2.13]UED87596.1 ABC transporter substrate-binding protein [Streptomyces sp. MA3_2.13]
MSKLRRRTAPAASLAAALVLVTAGCGGGDDSAGLPADQQGSGGTAAADGDGVKLGILGQCEGPFGGFHEDAAAGTTLALARFAGATSNSSTSALDGFSGAEAAGTPIELVGIGCGDDTADRILQEVRLLVEQNGANVIVGPLSGDEGMAVAEYAKANPELTVLAGISGSQEQTLQIQAPNYFRFYGDGAIWNAGLGDLLYHQQGWRDVAVIADDYSFGHTSAAGFVADFCAVGGDVTHRVFPPLGTTDYSSYIAQLPNPDEVDGYFWAVGGTGTQAALEAFINSKGDLTGDQHAGNLFFNPDLAQALGSDIAGAHIGGFATLPGDVMTPEIEEYLASADATWESIAGSLSGNEPAPPSTAAAFGFFYGYYTAGVALVEALEAVDGDISDVDAFHAALAGLTLDLPYGPISLDENNSGVVDVGLSRLVVDDAGEVVQETVAIVPGVDQSFGGTFSPDTPSPGRDFPACDERDLPWEGQATPVVDGVPQS